MFRSAHKPLATLVVLMFVAPLLTGCMSIQRVPFNNTVRVNRIAGVTTRSGSEIPFAKAGASITNDTLYAFGRQGQFTLSTDSIAQVWQRKFSAGRTAGLIGALAVATGAVAAMVGANAFGNANLFPNGF